MESASFFLSALVSTNRDSRREYDSLVEEEYGKQNQNYLL